MTQPGWVGSRWFLVPAGLLVIVVAWNIYVARHATGEIRGRVVDAAGAPVVGATVQLFERAFVVNAEKQLAMTDAAGTFRFGGNASHAVQLQADANGAKSERVTLRLLFRAQDAELPAPLVISR
jgi:hypothetical protein